MLRGSSLAKLDEKGRLKLPAAFQGVARAEVRIRLTSSRAFAETRFGSIRWTCGCASKSDSRARRRSNPSVMRFKNAVNYFGQSSPMDAQGRILIHPLLRDRADVRGEVVVLGQQDFLEVWNRTVFEERLHADPLTDADLGALSDLGI